MHDEILDRLDGLDRQLRDIEHKVDAAKREASDKGHTFIIIALCILLVRGCH